MIADSLPVTAVRAREESSSATAPVLLPESRAGRRWWLYGTIALVISGAAITVVTRWMTYRMGHVISHTATVQGIVSRLGPRIEGRVAEFHVGPRERVRKGDLLVTMDDGHLQAAVARWGEELKCAQQTLTVEQVRLEHDKEILKFELQQAQAELETVTETRAAHQSSVDHWQKEQVRLDSVKVPYLVVAEESIVRRWQQQKARLEAIGQRGVVSKYEVDNVAAELSNAQALMHNAEDRHQSERHLVAAELEEAQALVRQTEAQIRANGHRRDVVKSRIAALRISEQQIILLERQVDLAKAQKAAAEVELEAARLRAPEDGWVVARNVEVGASMKVGEPVITLWLHQQLWLEAWVDESRLADVHVGAEVDVHLTAYPNSLLVGRVTALGVVAEPAAMHVPINPQAPLADNPIQVAVQVELPQGDARVMPGLSAVVGIRTGSPAATQPATEVVVRHEPIALDAQE